MPRHKKTSISFIEACEEHYRLQYTVANTMPVCSLFDSWNHRANLFLCKIRKNMLRRPKKPSFLFFI